MPKQAKKKKDIMLQTLSNLYFQTLSVEYFHLDEKGSSNDEMKRFMLNQGYRFHSKVTAPKNHANDYIFVKNDFSK